MSFYKKRPISGGGGTIGLRDRDWLTPHLRSFGFCHTSMLPPTFRLLSPLFSSMQISNYLIIYALCLPIKPFIVFLILCFNLFLVKTIRNRLLSLCITLSPATINSVNSVLLAKKRHFVVCNFGA